MNSFQKDPIDVEEITFQPSVVIERAIVSLGTTLCDALIKAERYDEVAALSELVGEFTLLASAYGDQTSRIREDLGVGLSEAVLLKLDSITKKTGSLEWKPYVEDTKRMLSDVELH